MIDLPKSTVFNRRIPKEKFYESLDIKPDVKRLFIEDIKTIYWRNKISPDTVNIPKGKHVDEIQLFLIKLKTPSLNEKVLLQIDREIPYHILFLLQYEGLYKAAIGYKEKAQSGNNAYKVSGFYYTDWMEEELLPIHLKGINLDAVYENMLRDIAGERLDRKKDESIAEAVERDSRIQEIEARIERLENKKRRIRQLNKKMALNDEIRALQKEVGILK